MTITRLAGPFFLSSSWSYWSLMALSASSRGRSDHGHWWVGHCPIDGERLVVSVDDVLPAPGVTLSCRLARWPLPGHRP